MIRKCNSLACSRVKVSYQLEWDKKPLAELIKWVLEAVSDIRWQEWSVASRGRCGRWQLLWMPLFLWNYVYTCHLLIIKVKFKDSYIHWQTHNSFQHWSNFNTKGKFTFTTCVHTTLCSLNSDAGTIRNGNYREIDEKMDIQICGHHRILIKRFSIQLFYSIQVQFLSSGKSGTP